jgi:prolyl-tRNA editing enzyme YbaK/EbsC (Cys-tRNA(Pro) deacylase)
MSKPLHPSAQRFQDALRTRGFACEVMEVPDSARTAQQAADAVGCKVGQIAKSLIFRGGRSRKPILVITSGANRVNEVLLSKIVAEEIEKADAEFARLHTGFAIGGIPPTGHPERLRTFIDVDLLQYDELWAAAGTPHAVFRLTPDALKRMTDGTVVSVN